MKSVYNKELSRYQAPGVKPNIPAGEGAGRIVIAIIIIIIIINYLSNYPCSVRNTNNVCVPSEMPGPPHGSGSFQQSEGPSARGLVLKELSEPSENVPL